MAAPNESLRLLAEISGKLDHALRTVERGGGGAGSPAAASTPSAGTATPELLRAIGRLMSCKDAQEVVEATLDAVVAATGADRAFVMLLEDGRKLRFKGGRAIDQNTAAAEGTQHSKTLIRRVITTIEPVFVPDTSNATEDFASTSIMGMVTRSLACVPLRRYGGGTEPACGGVLYLDSRAQVAPLTENSVACALAIADAAAAALERIEAGGGAPSKADAAEAAALAAETQKLRDNMARLLDVGRAIGNTLVLDDLLAITLEKVLEVTKADRGFIMLLENGKPAFKVGRSWNKKDGAERRSIKLNETQFFFSRTIVNRALSEGRSICIKDTVGGGEDASTSIVQMELQSVMATPLREKSQTLGMIYVDSKASNREFDNSDLELFEALAGQAAIALQNAILYSQAKDKSRLESEINIASQMQQDMCPRKIPTLEGIDVAGTMIPAKEVGGDYYDFVDDAHEPGATLSMIVGDVSGKGLGSGIIAVMARCFLRSMITSYGVESPSNLLTYLNGLLSPDLKPGMFMTMLMVVWDARRKVLRYAAAGHEHLIVYRGRTRQAEALPSGGTALGIPAGSSKGPTKDAELRLGSGDTLVLYSDGVTEAMNSESEEFELERLLASVAKHGHKSAKDVIEGIGQDVKAWVGNADPSDDITLVALRKL